MRRARQSEETAGSFSCDTREKRLAQSQRREGRLGAFRQSAHLPDRKRELSPRTMLAGGTKQRGHKKGLFSQRTNSGLPVGGGGKDGGGDGWGVWEGHTHRLCVNGSPRPAASAGRAPRSSAAWVGGRPGERIRVPARLGPSASA